MKLMTIDDVSKLINTMGLSALFQELIKVLESDFKRWSEFHKSPRVAAHCPEGVIELMPTYDNQYYSFKYVNGHPNNTQNNKLSIVALGLLASIDDGHPLLLSEMTLLTALRTAATSALAAKHLAKKSSKVLAIIGTGAQAEFQTIAMDNIFGLEQVRFFDIDSTAMDKFQANLSSYPFSLHPCESIADTLKGADIITTSTATKQRASLINENMLTDGVFINAIGGDCPGKTELDRDLIIKNKVVVEFLPQSMIEGEIQGLDKFEVHAEFWEILTGNKPGRESDAEIIIFDSVGFAIEDFSVLTFIYEAAKKYHLGQQINLLPTLQNAKDLFSLVKG